MLLVEILCKHVATIEENGIDQQIADLFALSGVLYSCYISQSTKQSLQVAIHGAVSVRAYNVEKEFMHESEKRMDKNMMCYYPSVVANRWLAVRLEFAGNCVVVFAALFAILFRHNVSPGLAGLSVSYALMITGSLNWAVRMLSDLETNIVSIERIHEYSKTPTEVDIRRE